MSHLTGSNVSEFTYSAPGEILEPTAVHEVQQIIKSRSQAPSRPLRVVSSGYNWGLGSASSPGPVTDLISLYRLNSIREIEVDRGYAVIEAGVTQEQLTTALLGSSRYLNCTASSSKTSVIGNIMDRGVGLHGQRTHDLLGIEVVLPDGRVGTVGWWPGVGSLAANPWGLGPSALYLFTQSNFGIVTAATIRLRPKPSQREVVTFTVEPGTIRTIIDHLRDLIRDGVLSGVTKIYDQESSAIYGAREARIAIHTCIDGPVPIAKAKFEVLWHTLKDVDPQRVSKELVTDDPLMSAVARLYDGDTRSSETIVRNALNASTEEADEHGNGWIFALPFVPMRGDDVEKAIRIVRESVVGSTARAGTTVNVLDHDTVDLVVAISFHRDTQGSAAAHTAFDRIVSELVTAGYVPYRVDSRHERADYADRGRGLDAVIAQQVKRLLDPCGVLAPNRYVADTRILDAEISREPEHKVPEQPNATRSSADDSR
ncbi:FAD-binding oxidoreductase [Klebsiella pneumoniae]